MTTELTRRIAYACDLIESGVFRDRIPVKHSDTNALEFSPLTLGELNERTADANATIAHVVRSARSSGREFDDFDMERMNEAADLANAYSGSAYQRARAHIEAATQVGEPTC